MTTQEPVEEAAQWLYAPLRGRSPHPEPAPARTDQDTLVVQALRAAVALCGVSGPGSGLRGTCRGDDMTEDYPLLPAEFRVEPGRRRMAMRIPDEDDRWLVLGWATGSGIVRWRLTDDDVAEWTQVAAP